jgi:hypothetical protein
MNNVIYDTNEDFDFDNLKLNPPMVVAGGNYFIKYAINGSPLYIQPPECKTKGSISTSTKKSYCDLMFSQNDANFIQWMENLETKTCEIIFDKREDWFDSEMDLADIENYFASPIKSYKSGKFYLLRSYIPTRLGKVNLKIYNENKEEVGIESIVDNTNTVCILEIQGVKCSARSFQIEMEIKQMMTLKPVNLFENCLINKTQKTIVHHAEKEVAPDNLEILTTEQEQEPDSDHSDSEHESESITLEENKEEEEKIEKREDSEPISLEVIDPIQQLELENDDSGKNDLDEFEFNVDLDSLPVDDSFSLKPHNDIYYERYRKAQQVARIAKNHALQAYLEAKEIKNKYQLDDIESDDDDDFFNVNTEPELEESGA